MARKGRINSVWDAPSWVVPQPSLHRIAAFQHDVLHLVCKPGVTEQIHLEFAILFAIVPFAESY